MIRSFAILSLAALSLSLSACDSTEEGPIDEPVALDVQTATNVAADPTTGRNPTTGAPIATGRWALYSLRTNSVVLASSETDRSDSTTTAWDIGFRGTDIIVNGGTSGPGQGQAVVLPNTFAEVTEVPPGTTFRTDGAAASMCSNNILRAICGGTAPANTQGWYTYDSANNLINPTAGRTILVRTADGAGYAKIQIKSYYQNAPATPNPTADASRYYTFDFVLNPSGTSFEFEGEARTGIAGR